MLTSMKKQACCCCGELTLKLPHHMTCHHPKEEDVQGISGPNLKPPRKEVLWQLLKLYCTPRQCSAIIVVTVYYPPGQSADKEHKMINYLTDGLTAFFKHAPLLG